MFIELKRLLSSFRRGFTWYILFTLIRQALVVGGGYGLVLLIRNFEHCPARSVLIAFTVLVSYKIVLALLDQDRQWLWSHIASLPSSTSSTRS